MYSIGPIKCVSTNTRKHKHAKAYPTATDLGNIDDFWNVEVRCHGWKSLAYQVGLVGFLSVHLVDVLLGVNGHSVNPHLRASTEHSDGNFSCNNNAHTFSWWALFCLMKERVCLSVNACMQVVCVCVHVCINACVHTCVCMWMHASAFCSLLSFWRTVPLRQHFCTSGPIN